MVLQGIGQSGRGARMSKYSAPSDSDYYDELEGPQPRLIERKCSLCGYPFREIAEGEYNLQPVCDHCREDNRGNILKGIVNAIAIQGVIGLLIWGLW